MDQLVDFLLKNFEFIMFPQMSASLTMFSQNINADFAKAIVLNIAIKNVRKMEKMCRQGKSFWCFINRPLKGV